MKSWKTTLCGGLTIVGTAMTQFFPEYPLVSKIGGFVAAVSTGVGLLFARDNNVSSESLGLPAKPEPVEIHKAPTDDYKP